VARIPSYLVQIPEAKNQVPLKAGGDKLVSVKGGDFAVVVQLMRKGNRRNITPVMAAGVTSKLWEMSDMAKVLEDWEDIQ